MEPGFTGTRRLSSLDAEICFLIQGDFYYGPDKSSGNADRKKFVEQLEPPDILRADPSEVSTSEALGNEHKLAEYYEQVVRLARKHDLPFDSIRHYFWIRLGLWNTEQDVHFSFPWYDSFSEIERFTQSLAEVEDGLVYHDLEQHWEMEVHAHDGMLYIRQSPLKLTKRLWPCAYNDKRCCTRSRC